MANIELPAYRSIITNEVFGKSAEPMPYPPMGEISATQIARLVRFKAPSEDEAINLIKTNANGIGCYQLEKDRDPSVIKFLKYLEPSQVAGIANGEEKLIKHLREHNPKSSLQEGKNYL